MTLPLRTPLPGSRLPLATHVAVVSANGSAVTLSVLTEGWTDGERIHWNIFATPDTAAELRRIAQAVEAALGLRQEAAP